MKKIQAFKFQLKVTSSQMHVMQRIAGACRHVFNKSLELQIKRHENGEKKLNYAQLCKNLVEMKKINMWLCEAPSQTLQQSLRDLERAYTNFFKKIARFPNFKKLGKHDAFRFPQGYKLDQNNNRVYLPKVGWLRYRNSKNIIHPVSNITISKKNHKWYISIQTECEIGDPIHPAASAVGVDVGITKFATLSTEKQYASINSLKVNSLKLAHYQRAASRKKRFSKNWEKAQLKVRKLHTHIANVRNNYLHHITTDLSNNHALICIEDLQIKNMTRSASGTASSPGKNVRAKSGLNKSILDQGWYEFRRQLEYKQAWKGGQVLAVPAQYTSQMCPECTHVSASNRLTQSDFKCVICHYSNNADIVAATNILRAGLARLACGEMVQSGRSMKQEPTKAVQAFA